MMPATHAPNERQPRACRRLRASSRLFALASVATLTLTSGAAASSLTVQILDHRDRPVDEAVVTVVPTADARTAPPLPRAVMDQVSETFDPHVLVVPIGTRVEFPNHDDVRHHVYSFSDAKTFELPLYEGTPADPVVFDQAGAVALGCNIHDWMRGYIYVTDAANAQLSVEGVVTFANLAPGRYRVEVWHPRMRESENWSDEIAIASDPATVKVEMRLKPELTVRRAPKAGKTKYQ